MDQAKKQVIPVDQFEYLGRWVSKLNFRAFLYNENGGQKLVNNYAEYEDAVTSGIWFEVRPEPKPRKQKHDVTLPNGK